MTNLSRAALMMMIAGAMLVGCEQSSSPDRVSAPAEGVEGASDAAGVDEAGVGDTGVGETGVSEAGMGDGARAAAEDSAPAALGGERVYAGDLSFGVPQGWEVRPPSNQMRVAEVGAGGADAPVAAFSMAGGGIDANIGRWRGQFAEPDAQRLRETLEIAGRTVHLVEMAGSYRGMGGPAQGDTVMLAAIVEQPGQPSVFIKMTGPSAAVDAARGGFRAMVESLSSP
jgi:hypothetical protein